MILEVIKKCILKMLFDVFAIFYSLTSDAISSVICLSRNIYDQQQVRGHHLCLAIDYRKKNKKSEKNAGSAVCVRQFSRMFLWYKKTEFGMCEVA